MKLKVKIIVEALHYIEMEDYVDEWDELCADDLEDGEEAPPITKEFVLERFQQDVKEGNFEISDILAEGIVDVQEVR